MQLIIMKIGESIGSAARVDKILDKAVPDMEKFQTHFITVGGVVSAVNCGF